MTVTEQTYPPGTILAEMLVDIYASTKRDDVWIMHDKAFEGQLVRLELSPEDRKLDFVFEGEETKSLGAPLKDTLIPHFEKMKEITLYQIDVDTKQPKGLLIVPLTIKN